MARLANAAEAVEEVRKVRQARQYKPDAVPDDVLKTLLEIARWTGSSRNTQPWHFVVVTDKNQLHQISEIRPPIGWVANVPVAIAIVLDGDNPHSEFFDEGRVTERLMIAASLLGLGGATAWYGDPDQQARGKEILGIPAEKIARSVVTIGYPTSLKDPRPSGPATGRKPLSETVSYGRYGQRS